MFFVGKHLESLCPEVDIKLISVGDLRRRRTRCYHQPFPSSSIKEKSLAISI
jgi:hypothetical protein